MSLDASLLFEMKLKATRALSLGPSAGVERRVAAIDGGTFEGPTLRGTVEPGGTDWIVVRPDGVRELDVRLAMRTDAGELFAMRYRGYRTGAPEVLQRAAAGEAVDPGAFVYRTVHWFEAAGPLAWLNQVVAAGVGERVGEGPVYRVYQIG